MFYHPPHSNFYVETITPKGAAGRWFGHEGGAAVNGVSALTKKTTQLWSPPSATRGRVQSEVDHLQPGQGPSPDAESTGTLTRDLQPPDLGEKRKACWLSHAA